MIKKIEASVIIPSWSGKNLLNASLFSLKKQTFKNFETIVVDNGSNDGTGEHIRKYYPFVKIIQLDKNYGFARAVNEGIRSSKGEFIILINNDTEVDKDCIKYLVKAAKEGKDIGFVAAKILNFYQRDTIESCGDYIEVIGHAKGIGAGKKDSEEFSNGGYVFLATGGGSLFKKKVFEMVGFLDEDYFAYFEDVDLCLRAQMFGFKGWYEPKAVIYHIHKATSRKNPQFLEYLQFRNMTMTIIRNFPNSLLLNNFNWLRILLVNLNTIRDLALKGYLISALKAEFYILMHLPQLLIKRSEIQKSRKVSDEYIVKNYKKHKVTLFGLLKRGI